MPFQYAQAPPTTHRPQPYAVVATATGQGLPSRGEVHGSHRVLMSFEDPQQLTIPGTVQNDQTIVASAGNQFAVRTVRNCIHAEAMAALDNGGIPARGQYA
jgi:hypothetical protein